MGSQIPIFVVLWLLLLKVINLLRIIVSSSAQQGTDQFVFAFLGFSSILKDSLHAVVKSS